MTAQFEAWFRVLSNRLSASEISSRLRLVPTEAGNAGEISTSGVRLPHSIWSLKSPLGDHRELDHHLNWFAELLWQRLPEMRALVAAEDVTFFCSYHLLDGDYGGFTLSPQALAVAVELGVRLEIHVIRPAAGSEHSPALIQSAGSPQ